MKGAFLLDVEAERRARKARDEAEPDTAGTPAGADGAEPARPGAGEKPLEDYLARWCSNRRGSSSGT
jgi:hypothetical protein